VHCGVTGPDPGVSIPAHRSRRIDPGASFPAHRSRRIDPGAWIDIPVGPAV
jgi:hypothetical protein